MLADVNVEASWPAAMKTLAGVIGLLCIVSLIFTVVLQSKKLFGRTPPLMDELDKLEKKLHSQILETYSRAYKNSEEAKQEARDVRADMESRFEKLNEDRQKIQAGINKTFQDIERGLGRLEGKTE